MVTLFSQSISFILGALIGSFLNVVILRYGTPASLVWDRSRCPHCQHVLRWWELVPIISWLLLQGKCQRCQAPIAWQYPVLEVLTGILFVIIFTPLPTITTLPVLLLTAAITCVLLVLGVIDLKTFLLPDTYVVLLAVLVGARLWLAASLVTPQTLIGMLIGTGFLFLLWALTRGQGLGFGDVKLMIPLGALFGSWGTITLLFIAFCAGGTVGSFLLLRGKAQMKTAIPFGPFLTGTALLLLLWPTLPWQLWGLLLW